MWMNQPANGRGCSKRSGFSRGSIAGWTMRPVSEALEIPPPCNDPGFAPRSQHSDSLVLLVCTGMEGGALSLDVVLRTAKGDQTLAAAVSERDAIAEARRIGALYGASLAMLSLSGHMVQLEPPQPPAPRRNGSPLSGRRPRFLARRKVGLAAPAHAEPEAASERKQDGSVDRGQHGAGGQTGGKNKAGIAIRAK